MFQKDYSDPTAAKAQQDPHLGIWFLMGLMSPKSFQLCFLGVLTFDKIGYLFREREEEQSWGAIRYN